HGEHDDQRRHDERPVGRRTPLLPRQGIGPIHGRGDFCYCLHAFSLRSRIGRNCSCAFFNSVAGSAPDNVAVIPAPTRSRNSATGITTGRPSLLILAESITDCSHSFGIFTPFWISVSPRMELRNGTPPP